MKFVTFTAIKITVYWIGMLVMQSELVSDVQPLLAVEFHIIVEHLNNLTKKPLTIIHFFPSLYFSHGFQ